MTSVLNPPFLGPGTRSPSARSQMDDQLRMLNSAKSAQEVMKSWARYQQAVKQSQKEAKKLANNLALEQGLDLKSPQGLEEFNKLVEAQRLLQDEKFVNPARLKAINQSKLLLKAGQNFPEHILRSVVAGIPPEFREELGVAPDPTGKETAPKTVQEGSLPEKLKEGRYVGAAWDVITGPGRAVQSGMAGGLDINALEPVTEEELASPSQRFRGSKESPRGIPFDFEKAAEGFIAGEGVAMQRDPSLATDPQNTAEVGLKLGRWYRNQARSLAARRAIEGRLETGSVLQDMELIFRTLVSRDADAPLIEHPSLSQFVGEIGGDIALGKASRAITGAARKVGGSVVKRWAAKKALEGSNVLPTYMPELFALEAMGETGEQLAERLLMAADAGAAAPRNVSRIASKLNGIYSKLTESDRIIMSELLAGNIQEGVFRASLSDVSTILSDAGKKSMPEIMSIADEFVALTEEIGIFKSVDSSGVVRASNEVIENTIVRGAVDEFDEFVDEGLDVVEGAISEALGKRRSQLSKGAVLSEASRALRDTGALGVVLSGSDSSKIATELMEAFPNTAWAKLSQYVPPKHLENALKAATAVGDELPVDLILPQAAAVSISRVYKELPGIARKGATGEIVQGVVNGLRFLSSAFRTNKTLLGGGSYYITNVAGNITLNYLAKGIKAFNPKVTRASAKAVWLAAGMGDEASAATKYLMPDGTETTVGALMEIGKKYGIFGQHEIKMSLDRAVQAGGGKISRFMELGDKAFRYLPEKMRLNKVAGITDDMGRFTMFLNALDGTNPNQIAKALKFTDEHMGLLNRLSDAEKYFVRELATFYTFHRKAIPALLKGLAEHPERFTLIDRIIKHQVAGDPPQRDSAPVPPYLGAATPLPEGMQPEDENVTRFANIETPFKMLVGYMPPNFGPKEMQNVVISSMFSLMYGRDLETGRRLPEEWVSTDFEQLRNVLDSDAGFGTKMLRSVSEMKNISERGKATDTVRELFIDNMLTEDLFNMISHMYNSEHLGVREQAADLMGAVVMRKILGMPIYDVDMGQSQGFELWKTREKVEDVR